MHIAVLLGHYIQSVNLHCPPARATVELKAKRSTWRADERP